MSILVEIQNDLVNDSAALTNTLRKSKILAARLNFPEFREWVDAELVLQRRFKEGCAGTREGRRAAWRGSVWPVRCILGSAPATAATQPARTVPGAAALAPPGRPAVS